MKRPGRWTGRTLARDLAAEGLFLEIKKARGARQIGQGFRGYIGQAVEIGLLRDLESQHIKKGDIMLLQRPEQVIHVAAPVVDELSADIARAVALLAAQPGWLGRDKGVSALKPAAASHSGF
ncbi:MAG: hypothetical protein V4586_15045 [Pseudomonadota bacterium]